MEAQTAARGDRKNIKSEREDTKRREVVVMQKSSLEYFPCCQAFYDCYYFCH